MLPELVDLIVTFSPPELVLAFTMVSKRYSMLLVRPSKKCLTKGEYFNYNVINEREFDNSDYKILKHYISKAKSNSPFYPDHRNISLYGKLTSGPTKRSLQKMGKELVGIYKNQDLTTIKTFFKKKRLTNDQWLALYVNPHYEVFIYAMELLKESFDLRDRCKNQCYISLLSYERLEYLLANKFYCEDWSTFLTLSSDVDMYKKAYKAHIEKGHCPKKETFFRYLLLARPKVIDWVMDLFGLKVIDTKSLWVYSLSKARTAIHLYKRGFLDNKFIWGRSLISCCDIKKRCWKLYKEIPIPTIDELITGPVLGQVLEFKYEVEGITPKLRDLLPAFSSDKKTCDPDWMLKFFGVTKEHIKSILPNLYIGEYYSNWLKIGLSFSD